MTRSVAIWPPSTGRPPRSGDRSSGRRASSRPSASSCRPGSRCGWRGGRISRSSATPPTAATPSAPSTRGRSAGPPARCGRRSGTTPHPRIEHVLATGEATWDEGLLLFLERSGYSEETYHTFSYSPLRDDDASVVGMLCVVTEDTDRVIGERRMATLRDLGSDPSVVRTEREMLDFAASQLAGNPYDLPFTLTYLFDDDRGRAARRPQRHCGRASGGAGDDPEPGFVGVAHRRGPHAVSPSWWSSTVGRGSCQLARGRSRRRRPSWCRSCSRVARRWGCWWRR